MKTRAAEMLSVDRSWPKSVAHVEARARRLWKAKHPPHRAGGPGRCRDAGFHGGTRHQSPERVAADQYSCTLFYRSSLKKDTG